MRAGAPVSWVAFALMTSELTAGNVTPRRPSEWRGWESRQATVSEIVIHIQPIFDLSKPSENNWLGRSANYLHIPTREGVIRRALLFKEGDRVIARDIYQTERLLRALAFIKEARIQPESMADGKVRAHVWVRDAWTIEVDAGFQRVGTQSSMHTGIQEQNFLGTGKTIGFSVSKDHERSESQFSYRDPQLLGTRWQLRADYQALSDGSGREFFLGRPFYALSTPWAVTFEGQSRKSLLTLYEAGEPIYETPFWANSVRMGAAWAIRQREDRVWRAGVVFSADDRRYGGWAVLDPLTEISAPHLPDRRQRGVALSLAYHQEGYETFKDIRGMDVAEDYNLAWEGSLEVGSYTRRLGSTRPGPYAQLHLSKGWSNSAEFLTLFEGTLRARSGRMDGENFRLDASVSSYVQVKPTYQVAAYLGVGLVHSPDPENIDYVGGAEGLRGYPNYLHPGNAHWVVSVEHRLFTEQRWWGLFRVGYIAFVDAGAVHQLEGRGWSSAYPDVGVGLRLGDLKSSLARVLLLTVTAPLVRQPGQSAWQFGVRNTLRF